MQHLDTQRTHTQTRTQHSARGLERIHAEAALDENWIKQQLNVFDFLSILMVPLVRAD